MQRHVPLKRTGFLRRAPEPRRFEAAPEPEADAPPAPRVPAGVVRSCYAAPAPQPVVVEKFPYRRDERFRDMCRAMACQHCGKAGQFAGVTWAHSNQEVHGHAGAIKASDEFVAALCWVCHRELDQGKEWSQEEKVAIWTRAYRRTVRLAIELGLWPLNVPAPPGVV